MKWCGVLVVLVCILQTFAVPTQQRQDDFQLLKTGITQYFHNGSIPDYLYRIFQEYQFPSVFRLDEPHNFKDFFICELCDLVANLVIGQRRGGASTELLANEAKVLCKALKIESDRVCDGLIDINVDIFVRIIDKNQNLTGQRACGAYTQSYNCEIGDNYEWTIEIPQGHTTNDKETRGGGQFNVLHISDFHYDPLYTPGKVEDCGEPICCQRDQADPSSKQAPCGYWTGYTDADVPWHLMEEVLRQIGTAEFDYVYLTGDLVGHRIWSTSIENNTNLITKIYEQLRASLGVPVYPALGNHEPHPLNQFASKDESGKLSTDWLFNLTAELWLPWVTEEATQTIRRGGFYTVSPKPGLRVIVLNTNVCYVSNWWLVDEDYDPYGQLQWLIEVLLDAEKNKELVHIISHIPPGFSECLKVWSREYRKILGRFANTVGAHFNGHTHQDGFNVYYNRSESTQPINVGFNGGSITPLSKANPSYKIYQMDNKTYHVLDYEEWTFNVTKANLNPKAPVEWYKLYSFKDAYGVEGLEASDIDRLVRRMAANHTLIEQFYNFKYRMGDLAIQGGCDDSCQKDILCGIVTTEYGDNEQCERLKGIWAENNKQ